MNVKYFLLILYDLNNSVWQEWNIQGNKFISMKMVMGEQCGANPRQAEVNVLLCFRPLNSTNINCRTC